MSFYLEAEIKCLNQGEFKKQQKGTIPVRKFNSKYMWMLYMKKTKVKYAPERHKHTFQHMGSWKKQLNPKYHKDSGSFFFLTVVLIMWM